MGAVVVREGSRSKPWRIWTAPRVLSARADVGRGPRGVGGLEEAGEGGVEGPGDQEGRSPGVLLTGRGASRTVEDPGERRVVDAVCRPTTTYSRRTPGGRGGSVGSVYIYVEEGTPVIVYTAQARSTMLLLSVASWVMISGFRDHRPV